MNNDSQSLVSRPKNLRELGNLFTPAWRQTVLDLFSEDGKLRKIDSNLFALMELDGDKNYENLTGDPVSEFRRRGIGNPLYVIYFGDAIIMITTSVRGAMYVFNTTTGVYAEHSLWLPKDLNEVMASPWTVLSGLITIWGENRVRAQFGKGLTQAARDTILATIKHDGTIVNRNGLVWREAKLDFIVDAETCTERTPEAMLAHIGGPEATGVRLFPYGDGLIVAVVTYPSYHKAFIWRREDDMLYVIESKLMTYPFVK